MGRPSIITRLPLWGLARAFVLNAVMVVCATTVGWMLLVVCTPILRSVAVLTALTAVTVYLLPSIGLGVSLAGLRRRRGMVLAAVMFIIGLLVSAPQ